MDDQDVCECGHIRDEHYPPGDPEMANGCSVEDCYCFHFEENPDG